MKHRAALVVVTMLANSALPIRRNCWANRGHPHTEFPRSEAILQYRYPEQQMMGDLKGVANMHGRMQSAWLAAAEKSLATNPSTFAMMPMADVLNPDGLMAALRATGHQIDQPD